MLSFHCLCHMCADRSVQWGWGCVTVRPQLPKLTVRQSSFVSRRPRCHRASTAHGGAPCPAWCPLVSSSAVSIVMRNAGRRLRIGSGSTACGSVPWPPLGRSVSSGPEEGTETQLLTTHGKHCNPFSQSKYFKNENGQRMSCSCSVCT